MNKILIKEFRVPGDLFYTEAVKLYCNKAGIYSVSSLEEIKSLQAKVTELINSDSHCVISKNVSKKELIDRYFTVLRLEFATINI